MVTLQRRAAASRSLNRRARAEAPAVPPVNTVAPAITGTPTEGQTLSVSTGTWSGSPTSFTYQWKRDGSPIGGAINATRTLTSSDIGAFMTCTVTATNGAGSTSANSNATTAVEAAPVPVPVNTVAPMISGGTAVGSVLSATTGTWSNSPTGYTYQWRRGGVNIGGATAATYTTVAADAVQAITCRVSASNAGGTTPAVSNTINVDAALLADNDIFVLAGNSYEAQAAANDNAGWARFFSGLKGYAPRHWRHARGGDTLAHLCPSLSGRLPQITAMNPKGVFLMSPQNSMGVAIGTLQAQYVEVIDYLIASGVLKIVVPTQVRTGALDAAAVLPINTFIRGLPTTYPGVVVVSDRDAVIDMTTAGVHNGANDHTNARGAVLIGQVDGAAIASCFTSTPRVTDYTTAQAGNLNADWNMADSNADGLCDGWGLTNAYTGTTVTTLRSTFRSPGMEGIPCQVLRNGGASAVDPAVAGNELRLRKTIALLAPTPMTGRPYIMRLFVEITNIGADWASATGPINLAALNLASGSSSFAAKAYSASNGPIILPGKFAGLMEALPGTTTAQNANLVLDVSARPMQNLAADYEIRFGYVMVLEGEAVAYAAPYDQSAILPVGRPAIFTPPTFTGTASVGSALTYTAPGNVSGGGYTAPATPYGGGTNYPLNAFMARSPYGLPGDVAGNIEGARPSSVAAVPYAVQAGDVGTKLKMGVQYENSLGSVIAYSAESATVT